MVPAACDVAHHHRLAPRTVGESEDEKMDRFGISRRGIKNQLLLSNGAETLDPGQARTLSMFMVSATGSITSGWAAAAGGAAGAGAAGGAALGASAAALGGAAAAAAGLAPPLLLFHASIHACRPGGVGHMGREGVGREASPVRRHPSTNKTSRSGQTMIKQTQQRKTNGGR